MSIEVFWDDLKILNIEKKDNLFISSVNSENLIKARETGFPIYFLKQISLVSEDIAAIVKYRLPNVNKVKDKLRFKKESSENIEKEICDYINSTGCRRPTDKLSIQIDIN